MVTEGTYLGLGEMKNELDFLREYSELLEKMVEQLCMPRPDPEAINQTADQISALRKKYLGG